MNTTGVNVVCVKWGAKYGPEYVNRLYRMVQKNLSYPFRFYCLTEDRSGINPEVTCVPFDDSDLEIYWNKINIFREGLFTGQCLYFDLDTVIQKNIDQLISPVITGVYTYWNNMWTDENFKTASHRWKTPFNSSILSWRAEDYYWIWDKFQEERDWYIVKYGGDDKFLGNELPLKYHYPVGWIYSRLYGITEKSTGGDVIIPIGIGSQQVWYYPECMVCMLNGPTNEYYYRGLEQYWS